MLNIERFEVTENHLKLLKRMCVDWNDCEFGAPSIDPKRPYGNSNVISDMREILDLDGKKCPHCGELCEETNVSDQKLSELHEEMQFVLAILVDNYKKGITTGIYKREVYGGKWCYGG